MAKNLITVSLGIIAGLFLGYFAISQPNFFKNISPQIFGKPESVVTKNTLPKVIGFLPFWLIDKADSSYEQYINQISYFNVVIDSDGTIQKYTAPGESDPGWHSLQTGKVDNYLQSQKDKGIELSLTIFSNSDKKISAFLSDPAKSAENLHRELEPLIGKYGFKDINLDIEKVSDSPETERTAFVDFVKSFRGRLDKNITVTLDVTASSFVKNTNLTDPSRLQKYVDYIVLMGYDFHNPSSFVTGPVAPQSGAGVVSEFDIESAVQAARASMPLGKLILALPLYGYSWETIYPAPRAGVMPGSAYSISSRNVQELLAECASCSAVFDKTDGESQLIYLNAETGLYHQIFYPDRTSTQIKIDFADSQGLGGVALWALGYEDSLILTPLKNYLKK